MKDAHAKTYMTEGELLTLAAEDLSKDAEFIIIVRQPGGNTYIDFRCQANEAQTLFNNATDKISRATVSSDGLTRSYSQAAADASPVLRLTMQRCIDFVGRKFEGIRYVFCCFEKDKPSDAVVMSNVSQHAQKDNEKQEERNNAY